jgi:hypothetical protein
LVERPLSQSLEQPCHLESALFLSEPLEGKLDRKDFAPGIPIFDQTLGSSCIEFRTGESDGLIPSLPEMELRSIASR